MIDHAFKQASMNPNLCEVCAGLRIDHTPTEMTSLREIKDKLDAVLKLADSANCHQTANEMNIALARDLHLGQMEELRGMITSLAESQGKLLAALDDRTMALQQILTKHVAETRDILSGQLEKLDAGLHETAMRNHQQLRSDIAGLADAPLDRPGVRKRPKPRGKAR